MSFKVKTILLLVLLSLVPYSVTMYFIGTAYRNDYEDRIRNNMIYQLGITVDRLDQSLQSVEKDMRFISSLDVMNDILSGDLDRRITDLLSLKKEDLKLIGDFDVVDNERRIIASSDLARVGQTLARRGFMEVSIDSSVIQGKIGELVLHYDLENLTRLFAHGEHLRYFLVGPDSPGASLAENALTVSQPLGTMPAFSVILQQDRDFAFSILASLERTFLIALLIGAVVIATIALAVANYIVRPILLLASTARSVTRTNDYSQQVEIQRADEIGQLAGAFNLMVRGMKDLIDRLQEESENRIKLAEEKNRAEMLQTLSSKLSKYLSPQIYESIFSGETDVTLSSSRKKLTVFFSDIVNFTGTTDEMESEDLTQLLNQYLREMTDIALEYGATIDKYIGDAIMIFFGDPQSKGVAEDAKQCVQMAIAMQDRARDLQDEWLSAGFSKPFAIRVGIHTGYCTVGNFGTENRMDYTIVGSAVNLASRIESSAEPGTIFMSQDTYLLIKDNIDCVPAGQFTPKGFSQPVPLYRVVVSEQDNQSLIIDDEGFHLAIQKDRLSVESAEKLRGLLEELSLNRKT